MKQNDKYEQIEAYLFGDLTEKEAAAFESEIAADATLKREVDKHKLANNSLEILIEDSLREELKKLKAEETHSEKQAKIVPMRRMRFMMAAAAVIVALIGFITFQWANDTYSNSGLVASNYEAFQKEEIRFPGVETVLENASDAYEQGDFQQAIELLNSIPLENDFYAEAQYISGHSYFQQNQFKEAAQAFQNTINQNHPRLNDDAEWYLALSYLSMNETGADFQNLLNQIATSDGHDFQKNAQELKSDLDSFWRKIAD